MSAPNRNENENSNLLVRVNESTSNSAPENPSYCIYRVPKSIRKINEEAYTPQLISIGPLHHGKKELAEMEKQKAKYVARFKIEKTTKVWDEMLIFVKTHEQDIRNCYANTFQLEGSRFCKMILDDAIFIIQLFLKFSKSTNFFLEETTATKEDLLSDLGLLENQLPYFVIQELYQLASPNSTDANLKQLCFNCLRDHLFTSQPENNAKVKHFTDMRRTTLVQANPERKQGGQIKNLPCAMKLNESGVKFRGITSGRLLDIKLFEKRKKLFPCFIECELQIPQLNIFDQTESILRNRMALEQCHYPSDAQVCAYVDLMDRLIETEKDVELLVGEGIIFNNIGDNASVANMFNKLYKQIVIGDSCYYNDCEKLKAHYNNRWNHTKATLKRVYFSNPWRGTTTVGAVILLLLTIIQAFCSILEVSQ